MSRHQLRQASAADHALLVALEKRSQIRPWSAAQILEELEHPEAAVFVAEDAEDNARTTLVAMVASRLIADELWVLQVGTDPRARRRGLARELLFQALSSPLAQRARKAWLEVRASNKGAIALYRGLGFDEAGRRRGYYPPLVGDGDGKKKGPREDAVLFARVLRVPEGEG